MTEPCKCNVMAQRTIGTPIRFSLGLTQKVQSMLKQINRALVFSGVILK